MSRKANRLAKQTWILDEFGVVESANTTDDFNTALSHLMYSNAAVAWDRDGMEIPLSGRRLQCTSMPYVPGDRKHEAVTVETDKQFWNYIGCKVGCKLDANHPADRAMMSAWMDIFRRTQRLRILAGADCCGFVRFEASEGIVWLALLRDRADPLGVRWKRIGRVD